VLHLQQELYTQHQQHAAQQEQWREQHQAMVRQIQHLQHQHPTAQLEQHIQQLQYHVQQQHEQLQAVVDRYNDLQRCYDRLLRIHYNCPPQQQQPAATAESPVSTPQHQAIDTASSSTYAKPTLPPLSSGATSPSSAQQPLLHA
jgi:phage shock protein A